MRQERTRACVTAVAGLLLGLFLTTAAEAATFSVNPTQIALAPRSTSALLTLRNESDQNLRFELSVFAWSQSASGEMKLEPTSDIVFFPALLTLKPQEERKVRVGSVTQAAGHEKTYRIFVKELPPVEGAGGGGVRVLTTMGIPIFVRPEKEVATAALNELRHSSGQLQFALANTGTVHFIPQQITVRGLADGIQVFEKQVEGWYVLAGGRRDFGVPVPPEQCAQVTSLRVHVEFASAMLEEDLRTPNGACTR